MRSYSIPGRDSGVSEATDYALVLVKFTCCLLWGLETKSCDDASQLLLPVLRTEFWVKKSYVVWPLQCFPGISALIAAQLALWFCIVMHVMACCL